MTSTNSHTHTRYLEAGVDIEAGDTLITRIKPFAKATMRPEVLSGIGGFGALCAIPNKYKHPVLVSGTDGVGTKLKLAFMLNQHDGVGIDLVAMSVNDILVQGAEPLFFLDYFACGKLDVAIAERVIRGIASGCQAAGCALVGGETAEMPDMYPDGEYDLAGFAVGCVEREHVIDGKSIRAGDVILGLASSGAHSNGYSLIRMIIQRTGVDLQAPFDGAKSLQTVVMSPTRIYVKPILNMLQVLPVKGLAHITGGGILLNVPRILPVGLCAELNASSWTWPTLFEWLSREGGVSRHEMYQTFNCGIGMILVLAQEHVGPAIDLLSQAGETVYTLGVVRKVREGEVATIVV